MNMPRTHKGAALRLGEFQREIQTIQEEAPGSKGEAIILNIPGNQKRGQSFRKITRIDGARELGDTVPRIPV